jgi:MYXO-CTERM domain-containing protein
MRLLSAALAGLLSSVSFAQVTTTIVQVNATGTQLDAAGFSRVGLTPFVSERAGECFVNGCFTTVGAGGALATKGYLEFQFLDFVNNPSFYNGLYTILDVNYGSTGLTRDALISLINGETATTGVTALLPSQASDAQNSSYFTQWLPSDLLDAVVLRWMPNPAPATGLGLSPVYTFAWDVTGVSGFMGGGLGIDGAYGVPAPGAIGLLGLAGLAGRRRR